MRRWLVLLSIPLWSLVFVVGSRPGTAEASGSYARTRYPIVLAHGAAGFDSLFGLVDYFYGIPADLRASGATVYVTQVPSFASVEARGEELLRQIETIVAVSGAGKVHLIGHSQGGIEARYVLAVRPDLLASVTTVAAPHRGSEVADFLRDNVDEDGFTETVLAALADALGVVIGFLSGTTEPQDAIGAVESLTTEGMAAFNARYPAGLPATRCGEGAPVVCGVRLYSWTGTGRITNLLDGFDLPFALSSLLVSEPSDGLIGRCSAHFGDVLRDDYDMNHADEVNQLLGLVALFETNPKTVFRVHANRLKNLGL